MSETDSQNPPSNPGSTDNLHFHHNQPSTTSLKRNTVFYVDTVTFLVEDEIFKVDRAPFVQKSPVLKDIFSRPNPTGSTEGLLDTTPIVLHGVHKEDFEAITRLMMYSCQDKWFSRYEGVCYIGGPFGMTMTLNNWIGVLNLSRMWLMKEEHQIAQDAIIEVIKNESIPRRIQVARDLCFADLFETTCQELVDRPSPSISLEEAMCVGIQQGFGLIQLRDERQRRLVGVVDGVGYRDSDYTAVPVASLFQDELDYMRHAYRRIFEIEERMTIAPSSNFTNNGRKKPRKLKKKEQ